MDLSQERIEIRAAALDERVVEHAAVHDDFGHRAVQVHFRARPDLEEVVGLFRDAMPARVDDDQLLPRQLGADDPAADGRELLAEIDAAHDHYVGIHELLDRVGRGGHAEHIQQDVDAVRAEEAGSLVDVVRADHGAGEFLKDIAVLVGAAGGIQEAD